MGKRVRVMVPGSSTGQVLFTGVLEDRQSPWVGHHRVRPDDGWIDLPPMFKVEVVKPPRPKETASGWTWDEGLEAWTARVAGGRVVVRQPRWYPPTYRAAAFSVSREDGCKCGRRLVRGTFESSVCTGCRRISPRCDCREPLGEQALRERAEAARRLKPGEAVYVSDWHQIAVITEVVEGGGYRAVTTLRETGPFFLGEAEAQVGAERLKRFTEGVREQAGPPQAWKEAEERSRRREEGE